MARRINYSNFLSYKELPPIPDDVKSSGKSSMGANNVDERPLYFKKQKKDNEDIRLSNLNKDKFKRWTFWNETEITLWTRLNSFWTAVVRDFTEFRYASIFQRRSEADLNKDDVIIYDFESLTVYTKVQDEVGYDKDMDIDFSLVHRPENVESLSEEHYSVSIFYLFMFILFVESFIPVVALGLLFIWWHSLEYENDAEEEDLASDIEDMVIKTVYDSGYEILGYQLSSYHKVIYEEADLEFLHFLNVERFNNEEKEFFNILKEKQLVKYA